MTKEREKLLVVALDISNRDAKSDLLRKAGFDAHEAGTAEEALKQLADGTYGLVIILAPAIDTDIDDLCRRIKQSNAQVSILLTAATAPSSDALRHMDGLLLEPVQPVELVTLARSLLRLNRWETAAWDANDTALLNAKLTSLYSSSIDAIATIDADDAVSSWNAAAERLFGYRAAEVLGKTFPEIDSPDRLVGRRQYLQHLHDGEPIEYQALRYRKNGDPVEVWVRGAPIKAPDGRMIGACLIFRDMTAQKQREQHIHFLMRELTHRSKNLLAVIQAMARQSLSHLSSPEEFVTRFSERLSGLAGSHDLLSNVDWEGASLIDLIRSQLRHYQDRFDERFQLDGPDLFLKPEAAQNIGIALHELSTNAAKYGALSVPNGKVSIFWAVKTEKDIPRLQMTWQEKGGPAVAAPGHKGFGHVVMDRITGQALGGTSRADFNPNGVTWQLDVPAGAVVIEREKPE